MAKTLGQIFEENGLDPFDAFLLDKSEWPQEARELVEVGNANRMPEAERQERAAWSRERGERFDRDWE